MNDDAFVEGDGIIQNDLYGLSVYGYMIAALDIMLSL